ncbi:hypothetical protein HanPI659440_Chr10g0361541 [Helianthus annuus]|nr:hypothetical protein HanPI659440_Chr10g0361541 [Helianthus annuus]
MITLFEIMFAMLIEWIPFWSYAKLIVNCWFVIPHFSGAAYVYEHYIMLHCFTQGNRRLTFAMFLERNMCSVSQMTYYLLLRNAFRNTNQMRFKKLYMALIGK